MAERRAGRPRPSLLRARDGHHRVTNIELFFDLVFVFAVTQLSHGLGRELGRAGAVHFLVLLPAVWWVWISTSWVTNWLDPERAPVRLLLFALMLAGLALATAIPTAFAGGGVPFAASFVAMQLGRSVFMLWALGDASPANTRNFRRITAWVALTGALWLNGALAAPAPRTALWAAAMLLDYGAAAIGFAIPGLGRSTTADWDVAGGHLAERCGLFVIIALGESVLVTGAQLGATAPTAPAIAAFIADFIAACAMWWIYFDTGAERGSRHIAAAADPGRLARRAYTYLHLPIVGGIILAAVADALVQARPLDMPPPAGQAVIIGGPALYVLGCALFKRVAARRTPLSHLVGLALLAVLATATPRLAGLPLAIGTAASLVAVAVWEAMSLGRGRRVGPS